MIGVTVAILTAVQDVEPDCGGNMLEINACYAQALERAEERMATYLETAQTRYAEQEDIAAGIRASQIAFDAYREIECLTVYEDWKGGTIRNVMNLSCQLMLTNERTMTIWSHWLHYMDSTPPILPEPEPIEPQ